MTPDLSDESLSSDISHPAAPPPTRSTARTAIRSGSLRKLLCFVAAGCVVSAAVFASARALERRTIEAEFEARSRACCTEVVRRVEHHVAELKLLQDLWDPSVPSDWAKLCNLGRRLVHGQPSAAAVCWAPRVRREERAAFEEAVRRESLRGFRILEADRTENLVPAAERDHYFPLRVVEASPESSAVEGRDLATCTDSRPTLLRAWSTGECLIAPAAEIVQDSRQGAGLNVIVPLFREHDPEGTAPLEPDSLLGFVVVVLPVEPLVDRALPDLEGEGTYVAVSDASSSPEELLTEKGRPPWGRAAGRPPSRDELAAAAELVLVETASVAGRTWTFASAANPGYVAARRGMLPWILLGGCLIALVSFTATEVRSLQLRQASETVSRETFARERAEERLRQVAEMLPHAILGVDEQGEIVLANSRLLDLFGYAREDVVARPAEILLAERFRGPLPGTSRSALAAPEGDARDADRVLRGLRKSGGEFPIEISRRSVETEGGSLVLVSVVDMSAHEELEQELRRTAEVLSRSNRELEEFAWAASHDLREPLHTIAGILEALRVGGHGRLETDTPDLLDSGAECLGRMERLIDDLLAYARIGSAPRVVELVDCEAALGLSLANLSSSIEESGAQITNDPLPTVPGDAQHLVRLFQNLIGNAMKYRGGSPPRVHVSACRQEGAWLFSVRDNGVGVAEADRERIFRVFQRGPDPSGHAGAGLGLAICRRVVEEHGGRIRVESQAGQGSTFLFTLRAETSRTIVPAALPGPLRADPGDPAFTP